MFFLLLRAEAGGWVAGPLVSIGVVGVCPKEEFMVVCWLGAPKLRGYCWSRCLR